MKLWKLIPLIGFFLLGVLFYFGLFVKDKEELPSPLIGKLVPKFELPRIQDGLLITDQYLLGHKYLLNVWASWCFACRIEHPFLLKLHRQGIKIVGSNYKDVKSNALVWLKDKGDPYEFNLFDSQGSFGLDLGVYGAPETFFIDKKGVIRYKYIGIMDEKIWRDSLVSIYDSLDDETPITQEGQE